MSQAGVQGRSGQEPRCQAELSSCCLLTGDFCAAGRAGSTSEGLEGEREGWEKGLHPGSLA